MNIWRKILQSPLGKGITMLLALSLLTEMFMPTVAMALSGGPSQPEFQGFSEIGVSNMVDPFTGDFSYEIPLMTVPGPNGGYPININYNGGVGMEDEASWVGLGWTLNPGAINRNMRGVPDDFSGPQEDEEEQELVSNANSDKITKSFFTKNNVTVGIGVGLQIPLPEVGGADLSFGSVSPNVNLYYNTYKGVGVRAGVGLKLSTLNTESSSGNMAAGLNLSFDSNDGASAQPSLSFTAKGEKMNTGVSVGFGYNSRQGVTNTFLNTSISKSVQNEHSKANPTKKDPDGKRSDGQSAGNGISFASTSGVPSNSMAMAGFNTGFNLDFEAGALQTAFNIPVSFDGMLSVQKVKDWMIDGYAYPAYGTMYSGYRENDNIEHGRALMDYNREKDFSINLKSPMMPMPVMTHDVYSVTGAGLGGSFRAFRNDAGLFYEPRVTSDFLGVTLGMEVAAETIFKVGVDPTVNFSHSYSGKWQSDIDQVQETAFFRKKDHFTNSGLRTVDPFDFRFTGEMTANTPGDNRFAALGGAGAKNYTLFPATADFPNLDEQEYEDPDAMESMNNFFPFENLGKFKPKASNKLGGVPVMATQTLRKQKERKVQLVQYRTKNEILSTGATTHLEDVFVSNPSQVVSTMSDFNLAQTAIKGHHISEFTIVQPNGMRYIYGLPLYNRVHEEYYFAVNKQSGSPKTYAESSMSTVVNSTKKGLHGDKFFSSTKISPYTHAHLITQIVSPDYVDVDQNGPSDNDFGYWTKFNYQQPQTYKWRVPLGQNEVNYIEGLPSNPNDDKATFTYGERDMTYLHSVETKTHIAVFYVDSRADGRGVTGLAGAIDGTGANTKCLKRIVLYSKNDLETPIKTVEFGYDYLLCKGSLNSTTTNKHKLTLTSITFTYGNSLKGRLTPYTFEYGTMYVDESGPNANGLVAGTGNGNPDYSIMDVDRWGMYKQPGPALSNDEFPYVSQSSADDDIRRESATAWNLTAITLPTGAKIRVAYEMDDYAYVQDKPATEMHEIVGTGNGSGDVKIFGCGATGTIPITDNYKRIYFKLDDPLNDDAADVKKMLDELPDGKVYFKTWQRLQVPKGASANWAYDYVTGYAPVRKNSGSYGVEPCGGTNYGYFTLADDASGPSGAQQFFRKAGLQYLRYQRADLDMPQSQGDAALEAASMILTGIPIIMQALELIQGYYGYAISRDYCSAIGNGKPSFVKLGCADGIKYGGGHRVRKITISDSWDDLGAGPKADYGMEYFYTTIDPVTNEKISSGVASYEPLIGGDENPLRKAHYYGPDNKHVYNDPAFYIEEPFGESYFPAPVVGYSKVTIVNLANTKTTITGDGIQEKEFYTAKDFPIKASYTQQPQRIEDKQTLFIPLIASISFKGYGYSQGFYVELNDMHGKAKAETLYDADYWDTDEDDWKEANPPFVSKKIYKFKTNGNSVDNTVEVLDADQQVRTAIMGETSEMFSEMKEDFGYSIGAGAQINGGIDPPPMGIFFTGFPNFEYSENSARTLVTTKVVYRNSILVETVDMAEGAIKTTKNLLFDPENGTPLLTVVTSDYDNAQSDNNNQYIYNYTYPAHWNYSGMQAAYRNYRNYYEMTSDVFPNANLYFEKGDELLSVTGEHVWVTDVDENGVTLVENDGTAFTFPPSVTQQFVTVRSGKRNLQNQPSGTLTSLESPIGNHHNVLIDWYNQNIYHNSSYNYNVTSGTRLAVPLPSGGIEDCADPSFVYEGTAVVAYSDAATNSEVHITNPYIGFLLQDGENIRDCHVGAYIPAQILSLGLNPYKIELAYGGPNKLMIIYHHSTTGFTKYIVDVQWKCYGGFNYCMNGVLNASAVEFSDGWLYDGEYPSLTAFNDYLGGRRGIWRMLRNNAYFADRTQRTTQVGDDGQTTANTYIGRDGIYQRFCAFNWLFENLDGDKGNENNAQAANGWRWQAEVTPYGYSPYGYEIENRDALNIYSSQLYGYGNSLVTAASQNAAYPEIGFDGFEESPAGSYVSHGHIILKEAENTAAVLTISDEQSHTGKQSLKLVTNDGWAYMDVPSVYIPTGSFSRNTGGQIEVNGKRKYVVSFWYKYQNYSSQNFQVISKDASGPGTPFIQIMSVPVENQIEGWRRAEVIIDLSEYIAANPSPTHLFFDFLPGSNETVYIDDLRIHPFNAPFKSYVYDRVNYQLRAILDDNNYASFYNYDAENTLVQVKKETEEGVRTIKTTRKNVKTGN